MTKKNTEKNKVLGFLGQDLFVEGTIHSEKKMVVSGKVNGLVSGKNEVVVGVTGNVTGKIVGNSISVAGQVSGNLLAHKRLEIISSAKINGELKVLSGMMMIQEGAQLEAECLTFLENPSQKKITS